MKNLHLSKFNLPTKIFWCLLLIGALAIGGWTLYAAASYTAVQFLVLSVVLFVSALVNEHEIRIPSTDIKLKGDDLAVFAGTFLLGASGGVLLAASLSAVHYRRAPEDKTIWAANAFMKVAAAFAAANGFYFFLKQAANFTETTVAINPPSVVWLVAAAVLLMAVYRFSLLILTEIFRRLEQNPNQISGFSKTELRPIWINSGSGLIGALILHFSLQHFGLLFGVVILLMVVIGHFAYLTHNSRLAQKTKEITEASRVHLATVEALATAIDARDQLGFGHVSRTQIYAVGIGKILNLSDNQLQALNTGALLHDIGKLAVPDNILNKPGRLTPAEMEKIKIHAAVGAAILEKVDYSYPVVPTVKYHHEAWDGSGYPEGLKGENIPLTARILAVADSFDTLRGARPYRAAVSRDEARRFLINGAGTQFDRNIVDVFLRNLQKFETEIEAQGLSYTFDQENSAEIPNGFEDDSDRSYVEQIKRANREVYTLYELARVFSSSLNLHDTFSLFVKKIGELVPFHTCVIYLLDETQDFADAVYIEGENYSAFKEKRIKTGDGATGYVLKKRHSVYKIKPHLEFLSDQAKPTQSYSAMISLPLITDEKMLGAVSLYSYDLDSYGEEHMRLLEAVSRIASDAIGMALKHAASENRALTDPMTNLPNARSLHLQFENEAARASRNGSSFQILMLDLDGFKAVNDTFGHKAGDRMLKELARVMRGQLRDYDFLARYAGDEFVAIVPETDAGRILELCQRIEKAVSEFALPVGDDKFAKVGISIGAACYPVHGEMLDQVIIAADKAMYAVKAERKKLNEEESAAAEPLPLLGEIVLSEEPVEVVPPEAIGEIVFVDEFTEDNFLELDESHIVSSAIN